MNPIMKSLLPTSKYLFDFINTNISHKLECFQRIKFSNESKKIIEELFHKINEADTNFDSVKIYEKLRMTIHKGNDYELLDSNIKSHIENMDFVGREYVFKLNTRTITTYLFYEKDTDYRDDFFAHAIYKIYLCLYVMDHFSEARCSNTLSLCFYLTDLEKTIPKSSAFIDRIHVNTGFTFPCKTKNEINIFRKEEWFKVFIHECFHNFGLDFSHHESSHIDKKIIGIFPVKADVRLYETYCEMWAEIMNLMFIVFQNTNENHDVENLVKKLEKMLNFERVFSVFQCSKILKHFGISYPQLYERSDESYRIRNLRYKENTSVLSYYIIKSLLMYKINHFLEWCILHNGVSIRFGHQITDMSKNMEDYFELVQEHYQDDNYIKCLQQLELWFSKQEKTKRIVDTEFKTLRMSLFES
jgi:hypothetical protein